MTVAAVVLAAGAGSRFGGDKLIAPLDGRPLLQHVLDTLAGSDISPIVVVVGDDAMAIGEAIRWRTEGLVRNPDPGRGLASSLQVGLAALAAPLVGAPVEGTLVVLGDQPELRPAVLEGLLAAHAADGAGSSTAARACVPRYEGDEGRNPVLLPRALWPVALELRGDEGLGRWLASHPDRVIEVPVPGANPDVDRPGDLAALAWGRQVRANRQQVDRFREAPDGADFYASTSAIFRADPDRTDDEVVDALLALARPSDVWLDVGAGAGRYALPLARRVREVVAIEPSAGMAAGLTEIAVEHGIANVRLVAERWPMTRPPRGDVALIAHVGYDIEAIAPFLDALEAAAPRRVAVVMERPPAMAAAAAWAAVHGEARQPLPGLPEFVDLLRARGETPAVTRLAVEAARYATFEGLLGFLRRQTWVIPGSAKDERLVALARASVVEAPDGWRLVTKPLELGIVTWGAWEDDVQRR